MRSIGVSAERFKLCMGRFATGVTVVTTVDKSTGKMCGMTVSSFNSVSVNPPLVLFSIEKASTRFLTFSTCTQFVVNILSDSQENLSRDFAKRREGHWDSCDFVMVNGMPVICGIVTYFCCDAYRLYDGGDHKIVVGRVADCKTMSDDNPLLRYRSKYWDIGAEL